MSKITSKDCETYIQELTVKEGSTFVIGDSFSTPDKMEFMKKNCPWNFRNQWKRAGKKKVGKRNMRVFIPASGGCIYDNVVIIFEENDAIVGHEVLNRKALYDNSLSDRFGPITLYNGINHIEPQ